MSCAAAAGLLDAWACRFAPGMVSDGSALAGQLVSAGGALAGLAAIVGLVVWQFRAGRRP